MKLFLFAVVIKLISANVHYHEAIGMPEAARIKQRESISRNKRITNGNEAYLGQYPYFGGLIITLSLDLVSVCGSTLISSTKLVTAAHCWMDGDHEADSFTVVLGSTALFSGGIRIITRQVTIHEDYNINDVRNDIAIISIPQVATDAYIQPIKLADSKDDFVGILADVVGFGKIGDEEAIKLNQFLSSTQVTVIERYLCELYYGQLFTNSMICTDGIISSPCGGDSGGPLLYKNESSDDVLIGVISYGSAVGCEVGHPIVYTRITDYSHWIQARL